MRPFQRSLLISSARSQPDTVPATVLAASGPRTGMLCNPRSV